MNPSRNGLAAPPAPAPAPASPAVGACSALSSTLRAPSPRWRLPISWLACAAIAACGGGGDDPSAEEPTSVESCQPVPHAEDTVRSLNHFWSANFRLCQVPGSYAKASAKDGVAIADQDWLDQMATQFGNFTVEGILAHEWGHLASGVGAAGPALELQADCLAGVYLRWANMTATGLGSFVSLVGDPTHGTAQQRVNAVQRGHSGYQRGQTYDYIKTSLCPRSTNY